MTLANQHAATGTRNMYQFEKMRLKKVFIGFLRESSILHFQERTG